MFEKFEEITEIEFLGGVDTYDLRPYSITELHDIMRDKEVVLEVYHHDKTRN